MLPKDFVNLCKMMEDEELTKQYKEIYQKVKYLKEYYELEEQKQKIAEELNKINKK